MISVTTIVFLMSLLLAGDSDTPTLVLASHGSFRSCYECAKQSKNFMCNWNNKEKWLVACCEYNSQSWYCRQNKFNKCSPTFEVAKGMFWTHCPLINNTMCGTKEKNLTLRATPKKETFVLPKLQHQNQTDFEKLGYPSVSALKKAMPDRFDSCYYIIETPQYLYKSGTLKMELKKQKNVDVMLFSGKDFKSAVEGKIEEETSDDGVTKYSVDFTEMMVIVVTPNKNEAETGLEIEYGLEDTSEIDWYWKFYIENFSSEEGQRLLYIYGSCAAILICVIICGICFCSYWCCCKPKVIQDPETGRRFSRRKSTRKDSFVGRMRNSMRQSVKKIGLNSAPKKLFQAPRRPPQGQQIVRLGKEQPAQQFDVFKTANKR